MAHDTDDLELPINNIEIEALADRILVREVFAREVFVNDTDARRIGFILRGEKAAAEQRNVHHAKVTGADDVPDRVGHLIFGRRLWSAIEPEWQIVLIIQWKCAVHQRDRANAGNGCDLFGELVFAGPELRGGAAGGRRREADSKADDVVRIESGVDGPESDESANGEAGADEEHDGERHFGDYENVLRAETHAA